MKGKISPALMAKLNETRGLYPPRIVPTDASTPSPAPALTRHHLNVIDEMIRNNYVEFRVPASDREREWREIRAVVAKLVHEQEATNV